MALFGIPGEHPSDFPILIAITVIVVGAVIILTAICCYFTARSMVIDNSPSRRIKHRNQSNNRIEFAQTNPLHAVPGQADEPTATTMTHGENPAAPRKAMLKFGTWPAVGRFVGDGKKTKEKMFEPGDAQGQAPAAPGQRNMEAVYFAVQ